MNKHIGLSSFVICLILSSAMSLVAAPIGGSNIEREHLIHAVDLSRWQVGLFAENVRRDVRIGGIKQDIDYQKVEGYVGFELMDWLTFYAGGGSFQNQMNSMDFSSDPIWSVGFSINVLDHVIESPDLLEDAIRVHTVLQYSRSEFTQGGLNREWEELYASATLSLVNTVHGNKQFWPDAIALFIGPVYSSINSGALHEDDVGGFTAGVEVFFTRKASFHLGVIDFDSFGYIGGVHVSL